MKVHKVCNKHLKNVKLSFENKINVHNFPNDLEKLENFIDQDIIICEEINKKNITNTEKKPTKIYSCMYCNSVLSCNKNLWRHKQTCKFKDAQLKKTINVPLDEFTELINIIKPTPINSSQPNKVLKLVKILTNNKEVDIMSKILLSSFGIVYFIQPESYLNTNVYKVGMSDKPLIDRIKVYGAYSRVLFLMECNMAYELEQQIISAFKKNLKFIKEKNTLRELNLK